MPSRKHQRTNIPAEPVRVTGQDTGILAKVVEGHPQASDVQSSEWARLVQRETQPRHKKAPPLHGLLALREGLTSHNLRQ